MVLIEVCNPFLQLVTALALFYAKVKQVNVGIQGELVHWVNAAHVVQNGEEDRGSLGTWAISLLRESTLSSIYVLHAQTDT